MSLLHHQQVNSSTSKFQFSFPKTLRFPKYQKSYCSQAFYEKNSMRMKRSASIGYGKKYDFTVSDKTFATRPHAYEVKPAIDTKKGFTIYMGRDV